MKTSSPPSYYDIFPIFTGATLTNYTVPAHRGLYVTTTVTNNTGIVVENIDGTTSGFPIIANTATIFPLAIKTITTTLGNTTSIKIYGLL